MYNYLEAVKEDVKEYITENIDFSNFDGIEELKEKLSDDLWINDSVTQGMQADHTLVTEQRQKNTLMITRN